MHNAHYLHLNNRSRERTGKRTGGELKRNGRDCMCVCMEIMTITVSCCFLLTTPTLNSTGSINNEPTEFTLWDIIPSLFAFRIKMWILSRAGEKQANISTNRLKCAIKRLQMMLVSAMASYANIRPMHFRHTPREDLIHPKNNPPVEKKTTFSSSLNNSRMFICFLAIFIRTMAFVHLIDRTFSLPFISDSIRFFPQGECLYFIRLYLLVHRSK